MDTSEFRKAEQLYDYYRDQKNLIIGELTNNGNINIQYHCHHEYPAYYVHINHLSASRGYPQKVTPEFMDIDLKDIKKLIEFCKKLDIPYQEPQWFLASIWW